MKKTLIKIYNLLPYNIAIELRYIIELFFYKTWIHKNPWHSIKQKMIQKLQKKYKIDTFIETGAYMWDMINAQIGVFLKIYSIELSKKYYNLAVERFKKNENVHIILWDSSVELRKLLKKIDWQCLIFLDGHFSWWETAKWDKECPLLEELDILKNHHIKNHIIMIDDIRLCWKHKDYPKVDELRKELTKINKKYKITIKNDQIVAFL